MTRFEFRSLEIRQPGALARAGGRMVCEILQSSAGLVKPGLRPVFRLEDPQLLEFGTNAVANTEIAPVTAGLSRQSKHDRCRSEFCLTHR